MRTEDWVALLANRVEPVGVRATGGRFVMAWSIGLTVAFVLSVGVLHVNDHLQAELRMPMFWTRAIFCAGLAGAAHVAVRRLARPGASLGFAPVAMALTVLAMGSLAVTASLNAPPQTRQSLWLGHTAFVCPWLIALLATPLFMGMIVALRGCAPTQLRLAGAFAGFAAGAGGALMYTLHCPELAAPFVGTWYLLGMLVPAAVGASCGARLLRW